MVLAVSYTVPILEERRRVICLVVHSVGAPSFCIIGFRSYFKEQRLTALLRCSPRGCIL